jgi:hypothetical protein
MAYSKIENGLKYTITIRLFWFFRSRMNILVYIFVIGQVVLKLLIKRLAVAMVNKTVVIIIIRLLIFPWLKFVFFLYTQTTCFLLEILTHLICCKHCILVRYNFVCVMMMLIVVICAQDSSINDCLWTQLFCQKYIYAHKFLPYYIWFKRDGIHESPLKSNDLRFPLWCVCVHVAGMQYKWI